MQASLTLSQSAPSAEAQAPVAQAPGQPLQDQVQALRVLVQTQHRELEALQSLAQAQPLQGLTTDQPWGMALEGLVLGAAALLLGALSGAVLGRQRPRTPAPAGPSAPADFSDSMLYLADEPDRTGAPAAVSAQLHDPHHDAQGATLAHEEGDDALDYDRMALHQQGLSVTAGAGQVDSERVPLDMPAPSRPGAAHRGFGAPATPSEFNQQAAAEEVERVRRYLAQRRADRAQAQAAGATAAAPLSAPAPTAPVAPAAAPWAWDSAPAPMASVDLDLSAPAPAEPVPVSDAIPAASIAWEDLVPGFPEPTAARPAPADAPGQDALAPEIDIDHLEHAGLSEGASLLAGFTDSELAPYAAPPAPTAPATATPATAPAPAPAPLALDESLLEWVLPDAPVATAQAPAAPGGHAEAAPALPSAEVQLQLAIEFRDLGLWEEARARVLEILEQPDTGVHGQARAMLDELAQTAPAPLGVEPEIKDPWG